LGEREIQASLEALGGEWGIEDGWLTRVIATATYREGLALIESAGTLAEELDHHPTLTLDYRSVRVALLTHDVGGLTSLDVDYAGRLNEMVQSADT
jgi:4a-hydroxytetrahydrobiopterin dehydratase